MINEQTHIGKLSVHAITGEGWSVKNTPAYRLNLSSVLSNTTFKPLNMPPAAILVVRKMRDPLPGKLLKNTHQYLPEQEWQNAVNSQLNSFYQTAEKPVKGIISSEAKVVLFADTAELLVCYVSDLVNYRLMQNWWWKSLKKTPVINANLSTSLRSIFVEEIMYLPAVLLKLHSWHLAREVIQSLNKSDALSLCVHLAQQYALTDLSGVMHDSLMLYENKAITAAYKTEASIKKSLSEMDAVADVLSEDESIVAGPGQLQTFFRQTLPADIKPEGSTFEQVLLCGLGIVLHLQPWQVRNTDFQYQLIQLIKVRTKPEAEKNKNKNNKNDSLTIQQAELDNKKSDHKYASLTDGLPEVMPGELSANLADRLKAEASNKTVKETDIPVNRPEEFTADKISTDNDTLITDRQKILFSDQGITTELGGILYLLNLPVFSLTGSPDLSGCYAEGFILSNGISSAEVKMQQADLLPVAKPQVCHQLNHQISPWLLLELIAKSLLEKNLIKYKDDAIWDLLHELTGESVTAPLALQINNPVNNSVNETLAEYRLPPRCFDSVYMQGETCRWAVNNNRLYVWAATGYLLVVTQRNSDTAFRQARDLLHSYTVERTLLLSRGAKKNIPIDYEALLDIELVTDLYSAGLSSAPLQQLISWMSYVMPFIRYELQCICAASAEELVTELLACRGQIYLSSTHLDLVASLQSISIAARRGGLDRDPGWLPDIGRVISFHFD